MSGSVFDLLPGLTPDGWADVWSRLAVGSEVRRRTSADAGAAGRSVEVRFRPLDLGGRRIALAEFLEAAEADEIRNRLRDIQQTVLEAVAMSMPLRDIMDMLCRRIEDLAPRVAVSVLSVDETGHLRPLAGPRLPDAYHSAIDGIQIGPMAGSCGTAAWRGEPVEVTDIATDPLWAGGRALALPLGLRACWSSPIKNAEGRVVGTFAFYYDTPRGPDRTEREVVATCVNLCAIAIEHEEARQRIRALARLDSLTGLQNRLGFQHDMTALLERSARDGAPCALYFLDFDDFKIVNDTLGHWAGDLALREIAQRLSRVLGDNDRIYRLGGDEFAIARIAGGDEDELLAFAQRILGAFATPLLLSPHEVRMSVSIGIACAEPGDHNLADLLKRSDYALYRAKSEGHGVCRVFDRKMAETIESARALQRDLAEAVAAGALEVHYQPIVDLAGGNVSGFEALLRWTHPIRGPIPPSEFIPVAERTGLIVALGGLVLRRACRDAASWPSHMRVSVNLSPVQLVQPNFVFDVVDAVRSAGLTPGRLDLEITESVALAENTATRNALGQLRAFGVGISLDDFGIGYSSLSYLRSFPFDRIKIDMSFIRDLGHKEDAATIVRAAIGLARALGMKTTAEGIETDAQQSWLLAEACTEGQGYLFGRAMPAAAVRGFLSGAHRRRIG
ncbi:putative bifunctional diguanylate cyclase/phosphodiesterase [Methylobrevis pamukkalensis]|nr:EAL domain-containing protein [Methylobrevis pamukkalensis]